jgi:ketosteroid isomerase-like protein
MRIAVIVALGLFLSLPAVAIADQPPSSVMAPVQTFLAITQGQSTADLDALFTPDAVVIDENDPYVWRGPHAASQWWARVKKTMDAMKVSTLHAVAGPALEYVQSGDKAYLVLPLTLSGGSGAHAFTETGTLTFTFVGTGGDWKISTDTWTTAKAAH